MPHFYVDYSANMEKRIDIAAFCDLLRRAGIETGIFPAAGIRVRAFRADHVSIADGDTGHGYVHLMIRLRGGRSLDTRKAAAQHVFEAARAFLEPAMSRQSIAFSMELVDIDPELSPKCGTIRYHMKTDDRNG